MNEFLARTARQLNPLLAAVISLSGAGVGGTLGNGPLGALLGLVAGIAVALALCGAVALLADLHDRPFSPAAAAGSTMAVTTAPSSMIFPAVHTSTGAAMNGHASAGISLGLERPLPSDKPMPLDSAANVTAPTETEAKLMADGRYSAYHLAKAKRLLQMGDHKEAAYQASASLSHDPSNTEARELRKVARAAMK